MSKQETEDRKVQLRFGMSKEERRAFVKQEGFESKKLEKMHHMYGYGPQGKKCGECVHIISPGGTAGTYFKCELYGVTSGPGTDWRKKWDACGKFLEIAE